MRRRAGGKVVTTFAVASNEFVDGDEDEIEFLPKGSIKRDGTIKHPLGRGLTKC